MQLRCEDLPHAGIVLIPHDSPDFPALLADITRHIQSPPPGGPPPFPDEPLLPDPDDPATAILWNQTQKPLCASTRIWKPGGTTVSTAAFPSLLLPFGLPEERRPFETYWQTILPNSKRWISRDTMLGTNADVRPPEAEEIDVKQVTGTVSLGPVPPPMPPGRTDTHDFYEDARRPIARIVAGMVERLEDEKTVSTLNEWADARVPQFRRI